VLITELKTKYGINVPIFAEEILQLYSFYSRAYVFRMIKEAEKIGALICYARGVYFIPSQTFFGQSTISAEMVAEKKYLKNSDDFYGIYSGLSLLNQFSITTQVPNVVEIVTNNETTRKRVVFINNKEFIVRKSRCEINAENYAAYTLFQLFTDLDSKDVLNKFSRELVLDYINKNNIDKCQIISMSEYFPATTFKKMILSGVFNEII